MTVPQAQPAAGAPRAHRLRSLLASGVLVAFVAGLVYFFWPTTLGGCSTLTIVSGHSMEPTYYTGDLVWSRCGEPAVGDVVVYSPPETDGARVIHRITGGDGVDGWVIQGDNNSFVDPWTPDNSLVVGIARAHIPHLGTAVYALANPYIWVSLLLIAGAIYLWPRARDAETDAEPDAVDDAETAAGSEHAAEPHSDLPDVAPHPVPDDAPEPVPDLAPDSVPVAVGDAVLVSATSSTAAPPRAVAR